jgi:hypothetical protein
MKPIPPILLLFILSNYYTANNSYKLRVCDFNEFEADIIKPSQQTLSATKLKGIINSSTIIHTFSQGKNQRARSVYRRVVSRARSHTRRPKREREVVPSGHGGSHTAPACTSSKARHVPIRGNIPSRQQVHP